MSLVRRRLFLGLALATLAVPALSGAALAAGAAVPPAAPLSEEDTRDVARAVAYLQGLTNARGRFSQTDPRGGHVTGTFTLQRPGKARFDYDPPSGMVIASDGHAVAVVDRRLKTIKSYPLGMTPLALFLARDIRLDRGVRVAHVTRGDGAVTLLAIDAQHRNRGSIALRFTETPFALAGWTLTDARGGLVTVRLTDFARAEPRDPAFFRLSDPAVASSADH